MLLAKPKSISYHVPEKYPDILVRWCRMENGTSKRTRSQVPTVIHITEETCWYSQRESGCVIERQAFLVHSKTIVALGFLKNFAFCSSYCYFAVFKWAGNWNRWTSEILSNLNGFLWPCYILTQDNGIN